MTSALRYLCCGAKCLGGSKPAKEGGKAITGSKSKKGGSAQKPVDTAFYGPRIFTYKELTAATKQFSADELLGRGAFGSVFKGTLSDGSIVAVKQIAHDSNQGEREFLAEVSIISRIRHRNLVQLQGWCHEKGNLLLVYDYMPNGSLDKLLEGSNGSEKNPGWEMRHAVLRGVACALSYLHEECQQCVLHRDVKPSNVLLDENFNPHLADFGLARLIHHTTDNVQTTIIAGTRGYLAPELSQVGKASTKSDVFSFGVLALEVATGRKALDKSQPEKQSVSLVDQVWRAHEQHTLLSMADPKLEGAHDPEKMTTLLQMGLFCCHPDPEARPPMSFIRQWFIQEVPLPALPPVKPRVNYVLTPASPPKLALTAPEPKLAIEGPPAKDGSKSAPNGTATSNGNVSPTTRSPNTRSPAPRSLVNSREHEPTDKTTATSSSATSEQPSPSRTDMVNSSLSKTD
jgi:interleukin-1 receptor-associated kinase 1